MTWTASDIPSLSGRTAIVTGANSGIGLETAAGLAARGATVIMACRNLAKAEKAADSLRTRQLPGEIRLMQLDVANLSSVRAFAEEFSAQHPCLDLLINNAGVMGATKILRTKDGFESQFGTNHLGHFALTGLLLERLKAAPAPRVIAVSSVAHKATQGIDFDDPNYERGGYKPFLGYARSKLANLLFMFELDRRCKAAGLPLIAAAAHPGYTASNITSGANPEGSRIKDFLVGIGNRFFAMSAVGGARPTLYAATHANIRGGEFIGPVGPLQFWGPPGPVARKATASDPQAASRLWSLSQELTGVRMLDD